MTTDMVYQTETKTDSITLFLDYDGVLHPDEVYGSRKGVVLRCDGHNLFEHAQLLADLIDPYPQVRIVLSTSWVCVFGFDEAKARLPKQLQTKVKGATWHNRMEDRHLWMQFTRHSQIDRYVKRHLLSKWIAIDNDDTGWPEEKRHHLVHTDDRRGLGDAAAQNDLIVKIEENL